MSERSSLLNRLNENTQFINRESDDEAICYAYKSNLFKSFFYYLIHVLTLGLAALLFYWKPNWRIYFKCSKSSIRNAEFFIIKDIHGQFFVVEVQNLYVEDLLKLPKNPIETQSQNININASTSAHVDDIQELENQIIEALNSATSSNDHLRLNTYQDLVDQRKCVKFFNYQNLRYAWNREKQIYERVRSYDHNTKCKTLLKNFKGYSAQMQCVRSRFYGLNSIEVEVKSYIRLLFEEILNPFYIFQIFACILWMVDQYYYYASCIIIISLISMTISLVETRRQAQTLHDMVQMRLMVSVCRSNNVFEDISSEFLVPGDVIRIPAANSIMACDAVLLNGNCIVNESMLTGESVPVQKSPLPYPDDLSEIYDVEQHKRHTLFSGTQVVQTRSYDNTPVLAVVLRTGFSTSKGDLVRSILFPKPMGFKFYRDSMRFIIFLFALACLGMSYGVTILHLKGVDVGDIIIRALDIITIVVPPALPAAMTVGTVYAQNRLKKRQIYCISPPRINICGKLKLVCFDKTGTLTEDGLDLWGVVDVDENKNFKNVVHEPWTIRSGQMLKVLATCHSLSHIENQLNGDPLDVKMFESTKWAFYDDPSTVSKFEQITPYVRQNKTNDPDDEEMEIAIVKQFTFSSSLLRMSVLCKTLGNDYMEVFVKGAPEKITTLCKPETIPADFDNFLHRYTVAGYRVIALAGKELDPSVSWFQSLKLPRDSIESDLTFYGLLVMQNRIKPATPMVINELTTSDIASVMVTGDNLHTAINVARNCGLVPASDKIIIVEAFPPCNEGNSDGSNNDYVPARIEWKLVENVVDIDTCGETDVRRDLLHEIIHVEGSGNYHYAVSGKSFTVLRKYFPYLMDKILVNSRIYARMSPDQKAQLVELFMNIDYCVAMCGDGANDCGALKAAHVGISLSEAEASVASPFTSKIQDISCVPKVIKEGRAALVTSFGVFKYMALYSLTQFTSVLVLYTFMSNLSDPQFLYIDLYLITPVAIFMSSNEAYVHLAVKRPLGSLVGFVNLSSIIFQVLLVAAFQILGFVYITFQPWFVPLKPNKDHFKENDLSMETTVVFLVSIYQYVSLAFVFSKGPPYRKSILTNPFFICTLLVLTASNLWITIGAPKAIENVLRMKTLDPNNDISWFRFSLVGVAIVYFIFAFLIEEFVVDKEWYKKLGRVIMRKKQPKNKYKLIKRDLNNDKNWPPVGRIIYSELRENPNYRY